MDWFYKVVLVYVSFKVLANLEVFIGVSPNQLHCKTSPS